MDREQSAIFEFTRFDFRAPVMGLFFEAKTIHSASAI